jgi:hypothetical protein
LASPHGYAVFFSYQENLFISSTSLSSNQTGMPRVDEPFDLDAADVVGTNQPQTSLDEVVTVGELNFRAESSHDSDALIDTNTIRTRVH